MNATEQALLAAICDPANHADDLPRLAYADWLEENAGVVRCGDCGGGGWIDERAARAREKSLTHAIGVYDIRRMAFSCVTCRGSGVVSDGRPERAEFIRLQCRIASRRHAADPACVNAGKHYVRINNPGGDLVPCRCVECWPDDAADRNRVSTLFHSPYAPAGASKVLKALNGWCPFGFDWSGGYVGFDRGFVYSTDSLLSQVWEERPCDEYHEGRPNLCAYCGGSGRVGGPTPALVELVNSHPVEWVRVRDAYPADRTALNGSWYWFKDEASRHGRLAGREWSERTPAHLPDSLFEAMAGDDRSVIGQPFDSQSDATDALSSAILRAARNCKENR